MFENFSQIFKMSGARKEGKGGSRDRARERTCEREIAREEREREREREGEREVGDARGFASDPTSRVPCCAPCPT